MGVFSRYESAGVDNARAIERAVMENYWKGVAETGRHVLAQSVDNIAEAICRVRKCVPHEIKSQILNNLLESPRPEDLKPEALALLRASVARGDRVFIWTVGDKGTYTDPERSITYPEYNFQEKKIERSGFMKDLEDGAGEERVRETVSLEVSAENKVTALRSILEALRKQGVYDVYIADDQQKNIADAEALRKDFPEIAIHVWWVNNASEQGNLAAFRTYLDAKRSETSRGPVALVLDWDDTLYDEIGRVKRFARGLAEIFH